MWLVAAAEMVAVGVIAFLVRILGVTRQSLWLDEAYSVYVASHRLPQILRFTVSSDAHPPLYYLLLHTWMTLFGPSALAVRWLSLLASVAAVLVTYLVGRVVASHRAALLAATFMALSSFQIWYAQEARMYALTTLATVVALLGLVCALSNRQRGSWPWVVYAGGMLIGMYLDYSAFYVLLAVLAWFWLDGRRRQGVSRPFIVSTGAVLVGYLFWLPSFVGQLRALGGLTAWINSATGTGVLNSLTDFYFNQTNLSEASGTLVAILAIGVSIALTAYALWVPRRSAWYTLLALWVCCPLALGLLSEFFNHPITIARAMMVVQPALLLLLAMAIDRQIAEMAASGFQRVSAVVLGLLLAALVWGNVTAQVTANTTTVKEDWRGAAAIVSTHQQPGDLILFNAYFSQMPFDYYYHQTAQAEQRAVAERGYLLEESLLYADLTPGVQGVQSAAELESYGRVWLIESHVSAPGAPPGLATHFRLVSEQQLTGVTVYLYVKSA